MVKNLTRSFWAICVVCCGVPQRLALVPGQFYKINSSGKIGKLTGCLHLSNVLLQVVSLLDDLIDHVVHGQPSLHVPASPSMSNLINLM